ncbi:MAG TPA: DUF2085 domain-containing protein [Candidatus Polarisedimenticolia bacterium]|nr:DUF2085 domain-containing protein [Candidatus Polarisedimenticolia bacterium]
MSARAAFALVCGAAALWCALAAAPPLLEHAGHGAAAGWSRLPLALVCHQKPQRSFLLAERPMALCARCSGIAAGFLAGSLLVLGLSVARPGRAPAFPPRQLLLIGVLPMGLQWGLTAAWISKSLDGAALRAGTGALFGFVLAFYFLPAVAEMAGDLTRPRRAPQRGEAIDAVPTA